MSITFSCQTCGKRYDMSEELAGKRARCKQCATEFRVPAPAGTARSASLDPYGLAEAPPPRPWPLPEEDDEFGSPPQTFPKKVKSRAARRERNEGLFGWGIRFFIFGVGAFLLPILGFQWKGLHLLSESAQVGIGLAVLAIGVLCVAFSGSDPLYSVFGFGALGIAGLVFLLVLGLHSQPEPPPPPGGNPRIVPPPNFVPNVPPKLPPNIPRPRPRFGIRSRPVPTPSTPPVSSTPPPTFSPPPPPSSSPAPPAGDSGFPAPSDNSGFPPPR